MILRDSNQCGYPRIYALSLASRRITLRNYTSRLDTRQEAVNVLCRKGGAKGNRGGTLNILLGLKLTQYVSDTSATTPGTMPIDTFKWQWEKSFMP
jgi:hypothetical protein